MRASFVSGMVMIILFVFLSYVSNAKGEEVGCIPDKNICFDMADITVIACVPDGSTCLVAYSDVIDCATEDECTSEVEIEWASVNKNVN